MKKIAFFIVIALSLKTYASPSREIPTDYLDLGKMYIPNEKAVYELPLQYWKPEGVTEICVLDIIGIWIHEMFVDGELIHPIKGSLRDTRSPNGNGYARSDSAGNYYTMIMRLRMIPENRLEQEFYQKELAKKTGSGLFYETWVENDNKIRLYWIPYGAKEIYINYSICVINGTFGRKFNIIEADKTIRFELEWEEL
jgi:hypothetical protein